MNNDVQYEIKNENWSPCFIDAEVEREYLKEFNLDALKIGKAGTVIILIVWIGFALFDVRLNENARSSALFFRFLVITPVLLVFMGLMYTRMAVSIYQTLILLELVIIECSIYYVVGFYDFGEICHSMGLELPLGESDGKYLFIAIWLLVTFMGSMIARMKVIQSVLNGISILLLLILSIIDYQPSVIIIIITIPFLITAMPVVWLSALHVQQYTRQNFRAAKLLAYSMEQSESLLLNILPVQIADRLKKSPGTIADGFKHVSVLFADIVGFTKISRRHRPEAIIKMLNQIFTRFDQISNKYGAEKIKTIGDAYMLAAGIPEICTNHCETVANCALEMIDLAGSFLDPDGNPIEIRVGIHTGAAIAGVIGTHKFSYDIWGDTVNTASRMESYSNAGKIQVTEETFNALKDRFIFEKRGAIDVKGKGLMKTYWLKGRIDDSKAAIKKEKL